MQGKTLCRATLLLLALHNTDQLGLNREVDIRGLESSKQERIGKQMSVRPQMSSCHMGMGRIA